MSRNIFGGESMLEWFEAQGDRKFFYLNFCGCALHQYFKAQGVPVSKVGGYGWIDTNRDLHPLPKDFKEAMDKTMKEHFSWTSMYSFKDLAAEMRKVVYGTH